MLSVLLVRKVEAFRSLKGALHPKKLTKRILGLCIVLNLINSDSAYRFWFLLLPHFNPVKLKKEGKFYPSCDGSKMVTNIKNF